MLLKKYRLTKNSAFISTYSNKKVVSNDFFVLYIGKIKSSQLDMPTKVGFVVSKKNIKLATKRNKIKRQLREIYRNFVLCNQEYNINKYLSLVFVVKSQCYNKNFNLIKEKFLELVKQIYKTLINIFN